MVEREPEKINRSTWIILAGVTGLWLVGVACGVKWLISTSEFTWLFAHHFDPAGELIAIGGAGVFLGGAWFILKSRGKIWLRLILIPVLGFIFQFCVSSSHSDGLDYIPTRIYSYSCTSFFSDSARIHDMKAFLYYYPVITLQMGLHSAGQTPGTVMLFWASDQAAAYFPDTADWLAGHSPAAADAIAKSRGIEATEALAGWVMGWVLIFLYCLGGVFMFYLVKDIWSEEAALSAALIWEILPPGTVYAPTIYALFAILTILAAQTCWRAATRFSLGWGFLAGLLTSIGFFMYDVFQALPPLLAVILLLHWWKDRKSEHRTPLVKWLKPAAGLTIGLMIAPLVFIMMWGFHGAIEFWHINREVYYALNKAVGRENPIYWVFFSPYEFFTWISIPVTYFFAREIWRAWQFRRNMNYQAVFTMAGFVWFAAMFLSTKVSYEVSRILIFAAPLPVAAAAGYVSRIKDNRVSFGLLLIIIFETLVLAALF